MVDTPQMLQSEQMAGRYQRMELIGKTAFRLPKREHILILFILNTVTDTLQIA